MRSSVSGPSGVGRLLPRFLVPALLAGTTLLVLGSCRSSEPAPEPGPLETPTDVAADRANEIMGARARDEEARRERERSLVQYSIDQARELYDKGELEKAMKELDRALALDPENAAAKTLHDEIGRLLNIRGSEISSVAQSMSDRERARIDQQKLKALTRFADGEKHLAAAEFEKAIYEFEGALNIVNWNPYVAADSEFADLRARTERALEQARAGKRTADDARRLREAEEAYQKLKAEEDLAESRRTERIALLFEEGEKRFARGDYDGSEMLADRILQIDPRNPLATEMKQASQQARHRSIDQATIAAKREQFKVWREVIERDKIAQSEILVWPDQDTWDAISGRETSAGRDIVDPVTTEMNNRLKAQLKNRAVNLQFEDSPLPPVIDFIRSLSGINIAIDPEVRGDLEGVTIPGSLRLDNITVEYALNILLSYATDVTYTFREGVVFITKKAKAFGKTVVRLHDIRDISFGITSFTSPRLNLVLSGQEDEDAPPPWGKIEAKEPQVKPEDIIELIRANVAPDTWDQNPGSIDVQGGRLLVVHTPEVQVEVQRFLEDMKQFLGVVVTIESRFLTVQEAFLQDIGVDFRGVGSQGGTLATLDDVTSGFKDNTSAGFDNGGIGLPAAATSHPTSGAFFDNGRNGDARGRSENIFDQTLGSILSSSGGLALEWLYLDDTQVNLIVRAVEKTDNATLLTAPRLTAFNTQQASIHVIDQTSYIQDFEVEVAQTAFIADPVIGIVQDGIVFDVRPTVSNDRKSVMLEVKPTVATLREPIPTYTTFLSGLTTPVTIQIPEVTISRAATTVRVPDGGTVLLGGLKQIVNIDAKSETPWLADIPIIGFLFSRKGRSEEVRDLMIMVTVHITDIKEQEEKLRQ